LRRHRFHLRELNAGVITVSGYEAQHLSRVLRVKPGDSVLAFDGEGREASGQVTAVDEDGVIVTLDEPQPSEVEPDLQVTVAVALLKGDKLSDVVRRCTELGAVRFQPVLTKQADVPHLSPNKLARLQRVAREAAKQSGRSVIPEVAPAIPLSELEWSGTAVLAHLRASEPLASALPDLPDGAELTLITGPEGGFAAEEAQALVDRGATPVYLGKRILRAETAPVALMSAILLPEAR